MWAITLVRVGWIASDCETMRHALEQLQVVPLFLPLQDVKSLPPRAGIERVVVLSTRQQKRFCTHQHTARRPARPEKHRIWLYSRLKLKKCSSFSAVGCANAPAEMLSPASKLHTKGAPKQ